MYMYHIFIIHLSVVVYLWWFHILAFANGASMSKDEQLSHEKDSRNSKEKVGSIQQNSSARTLTVLRLIFILPACLYIYYAYIVPSERRRGNWIRWNWRVRWLCDIMCMLIIESCSSRVENDFSWGKNSLNRTPVPHKIRPTTAK